MAYCNIENSFIGKKLNSMLFTTNRNKIASLLDNGDFKEWFGKGKVDVDSNPILDSNLSFTNDKGEKKTIFDFSINFENIGEVRRVLTQSPGIHVWKGELFLDNTGKDSNGNFVAEKAAKLINTINFYYPGLLSYDIYQRKGTSAYSKNKNIPLPIVKINDNVTISNDGNLFSIYQGNYQNKNTEQFNQLRPASQLEDLENMVEEFKTFGLTKEDIRKIGYAPEVSQEAYNELVSFFKMLSPSAKVEELSKLSANGIAYINEFLIHVDKGAKYSAMPEEVAHFFVELLPKTSQLRKDLIDNITNFAIYGLTLKQYRDNPEYQTNGQPNYDKIKREAAAKLVAEYLYAETSGNKERLTILTKTKDSFIKRWWNSFLKWISNGLLDRKQSLLKAYLEASQAIINKQIDYLTLDQIAKSTEDNVWFNEPETNQIYLAEKILMKVSAANKMDHLQSIIENFRKDLRKNFIKIVKDPAFEKLNKELQKENGVDTGVNAMAEMYDIIKGVNVTAKEMQEMLTADNQILNISEFLSVIADMQRLAEAISILVDQYIDKDAFLTNIPELQAYREMFDNFKSFVNGDLVRVLADSDIEDDVISSIQNSTSKFDAVETKILKKLRDNYSNWMKTTIRPQNAIIIATLGKDLENALSQSKVNPVEKDKISKAIKQYINDLQGNMTKIEAKKKLVKELGDKKDFPVTIEQIFDKIDQLYVASQAVDDLLNGTGKDIDPLSYASHMVTAAIKNYDMIIANIANSIVQKKSESQNLASMAIREYSSKVDPILKELKTLGVDEYEAGKAITYIDEVDDKTTDKEGKLIYPDGKRKVVKFLNPVTNAIDSERNSLFKDRNDKRIKWVNSDPNTPEGIALKKEYVQARRKYISFMDEWFNSPYTEELQNFQRSWNNNDDFLEIKEEWDLLGDEERRLMDQIGDEKSKSVDYTKLGIVQAQKNALRSTTNKTGDELKKAELLNQYFEESNKFREEDERRSMRNFKLAYNNYEAKVNYALTEFLNTFPPSQRTIDNLETSLKKTMKDSTLSIKYKYGHKAVQESEISEDFIEGEAELNLVRDILLEDWSNSNLVKVRNQKFYDKQKDIKDKIDKLNSIFGLSEIDKYKNDISQQMNDMLLSRRDIYGQKNPALLTPAEHYKFLQLENEMDRINQYNIPTFKILDSVKNDPRFKEWVEAFKVYEQRVAELASYVNNTAPATDQQIKDLKDQIYEDNKVLISQGAVTQDQIDVTMAIRDQWKELASMSEKGPTQAYLERMEDLIPLLQTIMEQKLSVWNTSNKSDIFLQNEITNLALLINGADNMGGLVAALYGPKYMLDEEGNKIPDSLLDRILNDEYYIEVAGETRKVEFKKYIEFVDQGYGDPSPIEQLDEEFYKWFHLSHKLGGVWVNELDPVTNMMSDTKKFSEREYMRRSYYNYSEPSEKDKSLYDVKVAKKYRATKLKGDPNGSTTEELGVFKKQVTWKDSSNPEDWTVDNREGERNRYLPLSRKQRREKGNSSDKYLNKEYYNLQDGISKKDQLLEDYLKISLNTYFQEQENKPSEIRSMYNLPVTGLDSYQRTVASVTKLPDRVKRIAQSAKALVSKTEDIDAEDMTQGTDQMKDTNEITQEIMEKKVALGMNSKLPVERVNRNVLHALTMYIHNSKDFDTRSDLRPFIKGLVDVMQQNSLHTGHKNQKNRTKIIDQIYSQMILQEQPDNITNMRFFRKMANNIMRMAGWKLTGDVFGGAVNYIQANINNLIESFASEHVSMRNYATGYMKASEMIASLVNDFTKKSDYGFWTLMYQTFDFIQGEWIDDLSERTSTKNKKFDWKRMLMYPRTNGELHAQSAMGIGILDNTKIKNQIDGKMYPIWDIYKKEGNNIVLKEGFYEDITDEESQITTRTYPWNPIDGHKFLEIRSLIWSVNMDLHGNYAKINQTEASRHSVGKMAENMKRWFVTGFQRRFGREFFDINRQTIQQGYYTTAALAVVNIIKNGLLKTGLQGMKEQAKFYWSTPRKRQNLKRVMAEMVACAALYMLALFGFGYDNDDPNKNKKLADESWLHNELLLLSLRSYAEQTAYIPVPPFGFTEMTRNLLDPFSVPKSAFMNAVGTGTLLMYTALYHLGWDRFEGDVIYQKDTGSMFGEKGDYKLVNYIMKTLGYTGSQMDPTYYLKNYQSMQNRLK